MTLPRLKIDRDSTAFPGSIVLATEAGRTVIYVEDMADDIPGAANAARVLMLWNKTRHLGDAQLRALLSTPKETPS